MKHTELNKAVVDFINSHPNGYAYKRVVGANNIGEPDVTGCILGIRIELEGKSYGDEPTPIQRKKLRLWKKAGAITGVFYEVEEAVEIIKKGLTERGIAIET